MRRPSAKPDPARLLALVRLPSFLRKPIVSPPDEENWVALETITPRRPSTVSFPILPELHHADAQGLMEYPLWSTRYEVPAE